MMTEDELTLLSGSIIEFYEKLFSWEHGVVKHTGLSPRQNHTIDIAGCSGPIRMKPLAEKLGITTGTLTVMIDRLEKSGYVNREKDPRDGRGFNIVLTSKGSRAHKDHHAHHIKLAEEIANCLDVQEAKFFSSVLQKIIKRI